MMEIINSPWGFIGLILIFLSYLIVSILMRKFSKGPKCKYCKKGRMQVTKLEPRMMNFSSSRGTGLGGMGGSSGVGHNKSSVITAVTYQCPNCLEFITVEENR